MVDIQCAVHVAIRSYCVVSHREAGLNAMTRGSPDGVEMSDFHHAMSTIQPSAMREIYIDVPKVCSPIYT